MHAEVLCNLVVAEVGKKFLQCGLERDYTSKLLKSTMRQVDDLLDDSPEEKEEILQQLETVLKKAIEYIIYTVSQEIDLDIALATLRDSLLQIAFLVEELEFWEVIIETMFSDMVKNLDLVTSTKVDEWLVYIWGEEEEKFPFVNSQTQTVIASHLLLISAMVNSLYLLSEEWIDNKGKEGMQEEVEQLMQLSGFGGKPLTEEGRNQKTHNPKREEKLLAYHGDMLVENDATVLFEIEKMIGSPLEKLERFVRKRRGYTCFKGRVISLNLNSLKMTSLPSIVEKLESLRILDLHKNDIKTLSHITCFAKLRWLDLEFNQVTSIDFTTSLTALEVINANSNMITSIPADLFRLRKLHVLSLYNNVITLLPPSLGMLSQLRYLDVRYNYLQQIPFELQKLKKLEVLLLSNNNLSKGFEERWNTIFAHTTSSLRVLGISNCKISRIPYIGLENVEFILASGNTIEHVAREVIELSSLRLLNIEGTEVKSLPQVRKCYIRYLVVCDTPLKEIELENWEELRTLDVSMTMISEINIPRYTSLVSLTIIELEKCILRGGEDSLVSIDAYKVAIHFQEKVYKELNYLALSNVKLNSLVSLPSIPKLRYLELGYNRLSEFQGDFTQLQFLGLAGNYFRKIPEELPSCLKKLDMRDNRLRGNGGEVSSLVNLELLNLERNRLTELPIGIFKLRKLEILALSHNQFLRLPEDIGLLKALCVLLLEDNRLLILPETICELTELEELDVRNNLLMELPSEIGRLRELRKLKIKNNWLSNLPDSVGKLVLLTEIEGSQNYIRELPESLGRLLRVKKIDLCNNKIRELPNSLGELEHLQVLFLRGNCLKKLPHSFVSLNLRELDISRNQFTKIPKEVFSQKMLSRLYIKENKITEVPPEIENLDQLTYLNLEGNHISSILGNIEKLRYLITLDLSNNDLSHLPENICKLWHLSELYLENNCLKELPEHIGMLQSLISLDISGNSLQRIPSSIVLIEYLDRLYCEEHLCKKQDVSELAQEELHHTVEFNI